nr:hypothetical protein [Tanacetum cinerariifolium]
MTKCAIGHSWVYGWRIEELMDDVESSDEEWEDNDNGDHPNTENGSFLKLNLNAPKKRIAKKIIVAVPCAERFKVVKYSLRDNEEYVAISIRENNTCKYGAIGEVLLKGAHFGASTKKLSDYCPDIIYTVSNKEDTAYLRLHFTRNHKDIKTYTPYPECSYAVFKIRTKNILEYYICGIHFKDSSIRGIRLLSMAYRPNFRRL